MNALRQEAERLAQSELKRIAIEKARLQGLQIYREEKKRKKASAGRALAAKAAMARHEVIKPRTTYEHRDGTIEYLDPDHPERWSAEATACERQWAEVDRSRTRNGRLVSAICVEPLRIK